MKSKKRLILAMLCLLFMMTVLPLQTFAAGETITLDFSSKKIKVGTSVTLTATVTGESATVTWKSSNPKIASVSSTGVVTAKKAGNVTITATANGKKAKCVIKVKKKSYKELYKEFLEQSRVNAGKDGTCVPGHFCILNVNRKGVPELIITDKYAYSTLTFYVYTVRNNKVYYLGSCSGKGMSDSTVYYCKKYKGIYVGGWINGVGGSWEAYYGMNSAGKKLVRKQHATSYMSDGTNYIGTTDSQSKKVSSSKASSFCKKYFKDSLIKKYAMLENTAENREKI